MNTLTQILIDRQREDYEKIHGKDFRFTFTTHGDKTVKTAIIHAIDADVARVALRGQYDAGKDAREKDSLQVLTCQLIKE